MVVRPKIKRIPPIIANKIASMPSKNQNNKQNTISMSRKYVSVSPARGVPRSKSMNGLSRIDANKINENGTTAPAPHSTGSRIARTRESSSSENPDNGNSSNNYSNG